MKVKAWACGSVSMITCLCLRKVVVVVHLFKALPAAWTFTAYAVRAKHCGSMSRAVDLHCILLLTIPFFAANIFVQFRVYEPCPRTEVARMRKMRCD